MSENIEIGKSMFGETKIANCGPWEILKSQKNDGMGRSNSEDLEGQLLLALRTSKITTLMFYLQKSIRPLVCSKSMGEKITVRKT